MVGVTLRIHLRFGANVARYVCVRGEPHASVAADVLDQFVEKLQSAPMADDVRVHGQ